MINSERSNYGPPILLAVASTVMAFATGALGPTEFAIAWIRPTYVERYYFPTLLAFLSLSACGLSYSQRPKPVWARLLVGAALGHASSLLSLIASDLIVRREVPMVSRVLGDSVLRFLSPLLLMGWFYGLCIAAFIHLALNGRYSALGVWLGVVVLILAVLGVRDPTQLLKFAAPYIAI